MIKQVSVETVRRFAEAGERAGFTIEQMIELLNTGATVETLLTLIEWRLGPPAVNFMVMNAASEERYVCSKCGHTVILDSQVYVCPCRHCEEMRTFERFKSWQLAGR